MGQLVPYLTAFAAAGVATVLTLLVPAVRQTVPAAFFYGALAVSGAFGGMAGGIAAGLLSMLSLSLVIIEPRNGLTYTGTAAAVLTTFTLVGGSIVWLQALARQRNTRSDQERRSFQVTLSSIGDAVIATDAGGRVSFMNRVSQQLTGWTEKEALGRRLQEVFRIVNETTRAVVESPVDRVIREGVIVGLANHTILLAKDGREIPIDDSGAPIRSENGLIAGVVLVFRDITERKIAEKELEKARLHIEAILARVADGVIVMDQSGKLIYANQAAAALMNYPDAESLLKTNADELARRYEIIDENGQPMKLSDLPGRRALKGELAPECVVRFRSLTGTEEHWSIVKAAPFFGSAGEVLFAISTFHDITAQKRAEEGQRFLAEASKVLASSLDYETTLASIVSLAIPQMADGCSIDLLSRDGGIRHLNVGFQDPQKIDLLQEIRRRFPYDPNVANPIVDVLKTGRSMLLAEIEPELLRSSARGPEHYQMLQELGLKSAVIVPLRIDERTLGLLTFMFTGTARRYTQADLYLVEELAKRAAMAVENARLYASAQERRREAEYATRVKDEFLATLSHELRTPLNSILGWTSLLRAGRATGDVAQNALETIHRNASAQAQLIDDLLDMSRIISGQFRMDVSYVNLESIVAEVVESLRPASDAKAIRMVTVFPEEPAMLSGDPARLRQVVWNLLSNAVKFTPKNGSIEARIDRADSAIRLRISDSGVGIRPDFLPHVFERFRQGDGTSVRTYGGLGLGLTIVRHIVELHGGSVQADSKGEGHGAVFTVVLPVRAVHAGAAEKPARRPLAASAAELSGVRVLVVDDEADARILIETMLADSGASVRTADSVGRALEVLSQWVPDILLSDIGMPERDGFDLIRTIRADGRFPDSRLPAIALTAYAGMESRLGALSSGFQMHVPKPVDPLDLCTAVASLASTIKRDRTVAGEAS